MFDERGRSKMKKIAVMVDSTAYIPVELREKHNIHMVPLNVIFEDVSYREEVDITAEDFYEKMKKSAELPTTSQPSIGVILDKLKELAKEYDAVISIHLSSKISGTYQAVMSAGEMIDDLEVYTYDTELSAMPQGFFALEAVDMIKQNQDISKIINRLDEMKKSIRAYFMVDDLTNLQRGGRLSGAQALIGSVLQIKPILHLLEGIIVPYEKIRTRKKAIHRILGMLDEDANKGNLAKVVFIHGNDEQSAVKLRDEFSEKYPDVETVISHFGPVIGTHLGEGSLGVSWYFKP